MQSKEFPPYSVTYFPSINPHPNLPVEKTRIPEVVADGIRPELPTHRYFLVLSGEYYEVPTAGMEFNFSKERQAIVDENTRLEAEARKAQRGKPQ